MEIVVDFPGGARVDAHFDGFTVKTDQPPQGGGDGSAPPPFSVFMASLGACAGIYVLRFCQQRGLPTEGIQIVQRMQKRAEGKGLMEKVELDILVPPSFPEKYHTALVRSADQCLVKRQFVEPPEFDIHIQVVDT